MNNIISQDALAEVNALWSHIFAEDSPVLPFEVTCAEIVLHLQKAGLIQTKAGMLWLRLWRFVGEAMCLFEACMLSDGIATALAMENEEEDAE